MNRGYVYVLQNQAYGAYVVKIGLTRRSPDVRAREIYAAATGVPLPFNVAVAFSVADCARAEKNAHRRLRAYRLNNRREFFRTSPSIAATIVLEECATVNADLGEAAPEEFGFPALFNSPEDNVTQHSARTSQDVVVERIDIGKIRKSPVGTSTLTIEQLDRARTVTMLLEKIHPTSVQAWQEGFSRDMNPESELRIWEEITKAYLSVEQVDFSTPGQRREAFVLLLARSLQSKQEVLANHSCEHLGAVAANRLLKLYTLKPKPILVVRGPRRSDG